MRNIQKKTSVLCSIDDQIASKLLPTKQVTVNEYHTGIVKNNSCLNSTKGRVSHSGGGGHAPLLKIETPPSEIQTPPRPLKRETPFDGMIPRKSIINNNLKSS